MDNQLKNEKFQKVKALWEDVRDKYADKITPKRNLSGIPIKSVYTQEDISGLDMDGMPGVFPYIRGLYTDGYALTPWMQQMVFGYGTIEETRKKKRQRQDSPSPHGADEEQLELKYRERLFYVCES